MKAFAELFTALDETNKTSEKVAALTRYFANAGPADAAWAVYFLVGRRPRQIVAPRHLALWAAQASGVPDWLFEESYHAVGDIAETVSLILPVPQESSNLPLRHWVEERLLPLRGLPDETQKQAVVQAWKDLDRRQRFVWNKLITGAFRLGVSQQLVTRALAAVSGLETALIAQRLMGDWEPSPVFYERLRGSAAGDPNISRPYPFFLAHLLQDAPADLGELADWQAEWKWDGIRAQLIRRAGQTFLWSRGEELVTERYPEVAQAAGGLPEGAVVDGELLPWKNGAVLPFSQMQRRIGRKTLGKRILEEVPVILMAFDLLEQGGIDLRALPLSQRRARLEQLVQDTGAAPLLLSPVMAAATWEELERLWQTSRSHHVEGMMLKRRTSPYRVGRQRGDWWKWKVQPFTIDAVLIYAQPGSGKRASLLTDYTFGLWDGDRLVPIAKAYSGLTDEEIRQVDAFARRHTLEKFGPVRTVRPELVFELAFEGIQRSTRHKSGVAVRFPRMQRWRTDKKAEDADTLETLRRLLPKAP
jgi:DNA ligase-1